jgi:hypothetical protein
LAQQPAQQDQHGQEANGQKQEQEEESDHNPLDDGAE